MTRTANKLNYFLEISDDKNEWKIKVKVSQLWNAINFKSNNELMRVDMVLFDEKVSLTSSNHYY